MYSISLSVQLHYLLNHNLTIISTTSCSLCSDTNTRRWLLSTTAWSNCNSWQSDYCFVWTFCNWNGCFVLSPLGGVGFPEQMCCFSSSLYQPLVLFSRSRIFDDFKKHLVTSWALMFVVCSLYCIIWVPVYVHCVFCLITSFFAYSNFKVMFYSETCPCVTHWTFCCDVFVWTQIPVTSHPTYPGDKNMNTFSGRCPANGLKWRMTGHYMKTDQHVQRKQQISWKFSLRPV